MTPEEKVAQLCSLWLNETEETYDGFSRGEAPAELARRAPHGLGSLSRPLGSGPLPVEEAAGRVRELQAWLVGHTRLGIPALVHEECLTGLMAPGATVMPSPLNWGASFSPAVVAEVASAVRSQLEAVGAHQGLAPVLDVVRDQRYGRVEECIGEDSWLVSVLGRAYVVGLQGTGRSVMATVKHFAGHAAPQAGHNTAPAHLGQRELVDVHLAPFEMAVGAGAGAVMTAYHDIDGVPATASARLLTGVLRDQWGFDGLVVSDYWALDFLHAHHRTAAGCADAARQGITAGVDLELPVSNCYPHLLDAVRDGLVDEALVDRSVRRVLAAKFRLGLFERVYSGAPERITVDSPALRAVARRAAEASITLLSNRDAFLPHGLTRSRRVALLGPLASRPEAMLGNYSFANHVAYRFPDDGSAAGPAGAGPRSLLDAVAERAGALGIEVRHAAGCDVFGPSLPGHRGQMEEACALARWADVALLVVGDQAGHLGRGTVGEGSDADDLALPGGQPALVRAAVETGTPCVVVHVAGRAHDLSYAAEHAAAVVGCWFPGQEGPAAIAAVLFGDVNPGGRCPVTFSRGAGQQPLYYDSVPLSRQDYGSTSSWQPVYCFGHGLSYTTFSYGELLVDTEVTTDGLLLVACTVTNTGARRGDEVVQVYVRDELASVVRPVQQLRAFSRVTLDPGAATRVVFPIPTERLAFCGPDLTRIVEPGRLTIEVGASSRDVRLVGHTELTGSVRRLEP